jgi:plasmid maintenance system antidote protein VapI
MSDKVVYWRAIAASRRLRAIVGVKITKEMRRQRMTRVALARKLGVPPSRVTKLLSCDANLTLDTLARVSEALGCYFVLDLRKVRR